MKVVEAIIVILRHMSPGADKMPFYYVPSLDFLATKHIIKNITDEWIPETINDERPVHKSIQFKNGIQIIGEMDKLQFIQDIEKDADTTKIASLASKCLEKLEGSVSFKALGINYSAMLDVDNPDKYLIDGYLKHLPNIEANKLIRGDFGYGYKFGDATANIKVSTGKNKLNPADKSYVVVLGNYHYECPHPKKMRQHVDDSASVMADFAANNNKLFGLK